MSDPLSGSVGEAIEAKIELDGLLTSASGPEKTWLMEEAADDPSFSTGIQVHRGLSRLALDLRYIQEGREASQFTPENDFAEIDEQAEMHALEREYDIDAIHEMSEAVDEQIQSYESGNNNGGLTKKQQKEVKQSIKRLFRANWTVEEISDNPSRLFTIMNSLVCNEEASEESRDQIEEFITGNVEQYVKETARTTTPDVIAERLKASLDPSPAEEILQNTLIKPYFKAVEGKSSEEVLDNRETFIRGILRTYEQPSVCRKAMEIAKYQTGLLSKKGYYAAMEQMVPAIRLDQPQTLGRSRSIQRALAMIELSLSESFVIDVQEGEDTPDIYGRIGEIKTQIMSHGLTKEQKDAIEKGTGRMSLMQARMAAEVLGQEEYYKRLEAMSYFNQMIGRITQNPIELIGDLMEEYDESSLMPDTLDLLVDIVCEEYPEQRQFLTDMVKTDSIVSEELARYIPDPRHRVLQGEGLYSDEFAQRMSEAALDIDDSADPEEVANLFESSLSPASVSTRTDDGFVIEVGVEEEIDDPSAEFWAGFFKVHEEQIERAKARISQATGLSRQYEIIFESPVGATFTVRPETDQDRKKFHPIDEITGVEDLTDGQTEQELLFLIEQSKQALETQRRRFLNDRGIMYAEENNGQTWSIAIKKHPKNPQAFICTLELSTDSDHKTAKIFMDSDLKFQMGDKKVRSNGNLLALNSLAAHILEYFSCQEAVETSEGLISDEKNNVTARIAHLRLLPDGNKFSYEAWCACLEAEGLDLEVLSRRQQIKKQTERVSTYVKAVEKDSAEEGPLRIYLD